MSLHVSSLCWHAPQPAVIQTFSMTAALLLPVLFLQPFGILLGMAVVLVSEMQGPVPTPKRLACPTRCMCDLPRAVPCLVLFPR